MNCNNDKNLGCLNNNSIDNNRFVVNNINPRFPENVMYGVTINLTLQYIG